MNQDIESILSAGSSIRIQPQGFSMYPLFIPGRDEAIIAPIDDHHRLKRGDVILYRREHSILVLHRIHKVTPNGIYTVGDNQTDIEGPISPKMTKGILIEIIRNGKHIPTSSPIYILLCRFWLFLRPVRPVISRIAYIFKHLGGK